MPKFIPSAARIDAIRRQPETFREVCVPLYLPAVEAREMTAPRHIELEDLIADASGITIGDDPDDDFY